MRDSTRNTLERDLSSDLRDVFGNYTTQDQLARDIANASVRHLRKAEEEAALFFMLLLLATIDEQMAPQVERALSLAIGTSGYAMERAQELGKQVAANTVGPEDLTAVRAETIAATEVTAAASSGEMLGRDVAQRVPGFNRVKMVWWTALDERVCERCAPLHNTTGDTWGLQAPGGPPLHPRCRCSLHPRLFVGRESYGPPEGMLTE